MIGDANPALNALPQPQGEDGGCGDFAPIIELAIAIAVAYFAPEFLPELFAELGPVAGPIAQGATVAATGNVATQVVGNVLGLQHGFDWKAVAFAALSGGVGEGLGASGLLPDVNNVLGNRILRAAIGSALTQGIGVATGLQKSFSWRSVALAGVSAGVGQVVTDLIAPELGNSDTGRFATRFASNTVGSLVANAAVGGRDSGQRVLTDGFGQALNAGLRDAGTQEDRLMQANQENFRAGEITQQNAQGYRDAVYGQLVGTFNQDYSGNRQPGVRMAYLGNGSELGGVNFSGDKMPSMYPDPQVIASGRTNQGLPYEDWDSGARTTAVPQSNIEATALAPFAGAGGDLRYGSIRADQGYWASLGGIAGSDLSFADKASMALGTTKYYFRNSDEAQGAAQMIGGGLELAGAFGLSSTGVGASLGVPLALHGGDNIGTGFNRTFGYGNNPTVSYQLVESSTGSATLASAVDQGIPFVGGVGALASGMRSAWTITTADIAAGMRFEASQAATNTTPFLRSIADANGGEMLGLQYNLKASDSLARKIASYPDRTINDALRYTMSFDEANFTGGVQNAMTSLQAQGYEQTALSNTFKAGRPYLGINSTYLTPGGDMFELQFHTPTSFQMKDVVNHPLYELQRTLPGARSNPMWQPLQEQMIQNSTAVPIPPGALKIKGWR